MCLCGACCACVEAGCCVLACCTLGINRTASKYIYGGLFAITTILAWIIRDYSAPALAHLSVLEGCAGGHNCLGVEGVLRVSLGLTLFFVLMLLTTVGTKVTEDWRDRWHNGWWSLKFIIWFLITLIPFWIPSGFFQVYAEIARFGAGVFLLIQIVSIINFIYVWNDHWVENANRWWLGIVVVSVGAYILALAGIVLMYVWFAPRASCGLNIFFITFTLILILTFTGISLLGRVNAGLLTSGCMAVYIVYLCWAAIMSEPASEACNTRPRATGQSTWIVIVSFCLGFFAILIAIFTTGMDSRSFSLQKKEQPADGDVPYGYGFFHFVFAVGSMYMAMLFLGWDLSQTSAQWSFSEGWVSVWVQISASWVASLIYLWTMLAPLLFPDRDFS